MIKNKLVIIILIFATLLMISGCNKFVSADDLTTSPSPTFDITVSPIIAPTIEPSTTPTIAVTAPTLTLEELSMEAYEKFLKNM